MRFGDRVQFEVECDVDENKVIVPTFTFQPLLENAIIHGISPRVDGGKVTISVRTNEDKLLIDVSDTGAGMDDETLGRIRAKLEGGEDTPLDEDVVGIGLGNINRRIKGMYEGGKLEIESTLGEGTTIRMTLPLHKIDD